MSYEEAEPKLVELLRMFGPQREEDRPQDPFVRLERNGFWMIESSRPVSAATGKKALRDGVFGRFTLEFEHALGSDSRLAPDVANLVLSGHFPESMHADICEAVGLDLEQLEVQMARSRASRLARSRDPQFRHLVLRAYSQKCSMCGFGGLLSGQAVGVEAAHIKWHAADGPDDVTNGLALCTVHHKLFDRGVLGASPEGEILVSANFAPMTETGDLYVTRLLGRAISRPQSAFELPDSAHLDWHRQEVFSGPSR